MLDAQFSSHGVRAGGGQGDNKIREEFLESGAFPLILFTPTQIDGLPIAYTDGEMISLKINGNLTVHDVTQPVTFDATVSVVDGALTGDATSTILMSDFGVGPIYLLNMLQTELE